MDWLEEAKGNIVAVQAIDDLATHAAQAEMLVQLAQTEALIGILEELRKMNARAEARRKLEETYPPMVRKI